MVDSEFERQGEELIAFTEEIGRINVIFEKIIIKEE